MDRRFRAFTESHNQKCNQPYSRSLVTDDDRGSQKRFCDHSTMGSISFNVSYLISVHTKEESPNIKQNTDVKTQLTRDKSNTGENPRYILHPKTKGRQKKIFSHTCYKGRTVNQC